VKALNVRHGKLAHNHPSSAQVLFPTVLRTLVYQRRFQGTRYSTRVGCDYGRSWWLHVRCCQGRRYAVFLCPAALFNCSSQAKPKRRLPRCAQVETAVRAFNDASETKSPTTRFWPMKSSESPAKNDLKRCVWSVVGRVRNLVDRWIFGFGRWSFVERKAMF